MNLFLAKHNLRKYEKNILKSFMVNCSRFKDYKITNKLDKHYLFQKIL